MVVDELHNELLFREWALSTWEAWRRYHHVARQWVEEATATG
jgi:hypothetical protein